MICDRLEEIVNIIDPTMIKCDNCNQYVGKEDYKNEEEICKNCFRDKVHEIVLINIDPSSVGKNDLSDTIFISILERLDFEWSIRTYDRSLYYLKNVKCRGYPDTDKLKKVIGNFEDEWFYHVWSDEILDIVRFNEISVLGRSGGWWGIPVSDLQFIIDTDKLVEWLDDNSESMLTDYIETSVEAITDEIYINPDLWIIDKDSMVRIKELDRIIESVCDQYEDVKFWVEHLSEIKNKCIV